MKQYGMKEHILKDLDKLEAAKCVATQNGYHSTSEAIQGLIIVLACEFTRKYRQEQHDPFGP